MVDCMYTAGCLLVWLALCLPSPQFSACHRALQPVHCPSLAACDGGRRKTMVCFRLPCLPPSASFGPLVVRGVPVECVVWNEAKISTRLQINEKRKHIRRLPTVLTDSSSQDPRSTSSVRKLHASDIGCMSAFAMIFRPRCL
eukprot:GHVT01063577.1.p1 GENE.GHVT01063577.1~~GHVT01063577.1.p1  ORF type:complete len:142 (-),score=14.96 GHVT01063577.1:1065-1490(-)